MAVNFDVQARADALEKELSFHVKVEKWRASADYWIAFILMVTALCSSVAAGIGGLAFEWSAHSTAIVALIPGAVALIAATMKFEGKSNWHYRKLYGFSSLRTRLQYELPLVPSVDHIAAIAKAKRELITEMEKEWEAVLALNFNQLKAHQKINTNGD